MFDWDEAEKYLNMLIDEYRAIGVCGILGLMLVLYPLKARYDSGERTEELYNAIMECE